MKLLLKFFGAILALILLAAGGFAATHWSMVTQIVRFSPLILPPLNMKPADRAAAQRQDIRFLRNLLKYDRSFSPDERAAFEAHLDQLEGRAGMSEAEFYLGVAEAAAITDNGHTNISNRPAYTQFNHAGVRFYWFKDGLYVVRAEESLADLVGARVTAIEGETPEATNAALAKYWGGAPQWRRLYNVMLMESPALMHAAGLAASPDALSITVKDVSGAVHEATLPARPRVEIEDLPTIRPWMTLSADVLPNESDDWRRTLSFEGDAAPLYLRDPQVNFFTHVSHGGVYLRPQLLLEREGSPLREQFAAVIAAAPEDGYAFMIVDLRWSPGGDYTKVIDFVKAAPGAVKDGGKLYIVTGPQTFSAALVTAAFLKFYGGEKSVLIGEPMGDVGQFWAETGFPFTLPNAGYRVSYATGYHDWENGCADSHEYCFSQNILHEVPAGSLLPMEPVAPTYADYASGRDVVMERIEAALGVTD